MIGSPDSDAIKTNRIQTLVYVFEAHVQEIGKFSVNVNIRIKIQPERTKPIQNKNKLDEEHRYGDEVDPVIKKIFDPKPFDIH